jgi:hypothetical protein
MRVVIMVALFALVLPQPSAAQRGIERRAALDANGFVHIWVSHAAVRVSGWDRDSVLVTGTIAAGERLVFGGGPGGVKLALETPERESSKPGESWLDVRVPARSQVWIKSASGRIDVADFTGSLDAYSVTGAIRVSGSLREITTESMGGDVVIDASASFVRARSASGSIVLTGSSADANVSTVSGAIAITGGGIQRGRFESVDGDIEYTGALGRGMSLEFVNHGGAIALSLPANTAGEFSINTFQGSVQNDFSARTPRVSREMRASNLEFTLGSFNGTRVMLRNFKGPIVLSRS